MEEPKQNPGLILGLRPANERRRYFVEVELKKKRNGDMGRVSTCQKKWRRLSLAGRKPITSPEITDAHKLLAER